MTTTVHIVGLGLRVGTLERQRCAWCGEVILDEDLANLASPDGNVGSLLWECGRLIEITRSEDGGFRGSTILPDPAELPANCCAKRRPKLELVR